MQIQVRTQRVYLLFATEPEVMELCKGNSKRARHLKQMLEAQGVSYSELKRGQTKAPLEGGVKELCRICGGGYEPTGITKHEKSCAQKNHVLYDELPPRLEGMPVIPLLPAHVSKGR